MINRILFRIWFVLAMVLAPATAFAQRRDGPEREIYDARVEGYPVNTTLDGSTALMWLLLVFITMVGLAVLFKDARRTHLD